MKKQIYSLMTVVVMVILMIPSVYAEDTLPEEGMVIHGFKVTERSKSKSYNADVVRFTHEKTGAELMYIANEDTNRTFDIAFRTPAQDNGISHVFEHSTLGGSKKYPTELFFYVSSQTVSTYLNAFTMNRATAYPIASISDEQLLRLADYYLDGVFNPLILSDKSIFEREAWRYELESPEAELTLNGTVYSEMKGAMTADTRAYYNSIKAALPGSNTAAVSGGDPALIPYLTYEEVVAYHEKYYRPSNSLTVLYGKLDYEKYLELADGYFSNYDNTAVEISDSEYTPLDENIEETKTIPGNEDSKNILYYIVPVAAESEDELNRLIMCTNILSAPSSPFSQMIKNEFPGVKAQLSFEKTTQTPLFLISANVEGEDAQRFKEAVNSVFQDIADRGISENIMDSLIAAQERSDLMIAESGSNIGINLVTNIDYFWSGNGNAMSYFNFLNFAGNLKESVGTYEKLIEKYLVNPKASALVLNIPDVGVSAAMEAELKDRLAGIKANMSNEEINAAVKATNDKPQTTVDAAELMKRINVSAPDNLKNELENYRDKEYPYTDETINGARYLSANADIGNICLARIYFDASELSGKQLQYLALYDMLIGSLDTDTLSQQELSALLERYFSGDSKLLPTDDGTLYYTLKFNALNDDIEHVYSAIYEALFGTSFDDTERIHYYVKQALASAESNVTASAMNVIMQRMQAHGSIKAAVYDYTQNLPFINFLKEIDKLLDETPETVKAELENIQNTLRNRYNSSFIFAGNNEGLRINKEMVVRFTEQLEYREHGKSDWGIELPSGNEAVIIPSDVNYNVLYAPLGEVGAERNGSLYVTEMLVNDKLLVPQLRHSNGAYGTEWVVNEYGMLVGSYRDPNVVKTYEYFDKIADLLEETELTQQELDGYIASSFAKNSQQRGLLNDTYHMLTTKVYTSEKNKYDYMSEILNTTPEQVKSYAAVYRALSEKGEKGTIGNETAVTENKSLFDTITNPFENDEIKILLNGSQIKTDTEPVIENDRVLVPLRVLLEAMGAEVSWNESEQRVTIVFNGRSMELHIGAQEMVVDNETILLDAAPEIINDRTMVPIRAIAEACGCKVDWDSDSREVMVVNE
ncbi:MAG: stalk domain-containing protein [bacterium]|nr:stalk domain-containing protein [bacterium]